MNRHTSGSMPYNRLTLRNKYIVSTSYFFLPKKIRLPTYNFPQKRTAVVCRNSHEPQLPFWLVVRSVPNVCWNSASSEKHYRSFRVPHRNPVVNSNEQYPRNFAPPHYDIYNLRHSVTSLDLAWTVFTDERSITFSYMVSTINHFTNRINVVSNDKVRV